MPLTELPVEHLFTVIAEIASPELIAGAPHGTRAVINVTGGHFEGPRLNGRVAAGPGGDWATVRADGTLRLDVRLLLQTDDGANILMTYAGVGQATADGFALRTAPLFETGDERYAWLNAVQAVGLGQSAPESVTYEVYAVS